MGDNGEIQKLNHRHLAIMEMMVQCPHLTQGEIARKLGYSESRFSAIVNSPLFQMAYQEFRRRHQDNISEHVIEVTKEALKASQEIISDRQLPATIRQISIRDILNLGHAKAVEKSASVRASVEMDTQQFQQLLKVASELNNPFVPSRPMRRPESNEGEEAEV